MADSTAERSESERFRHRRVQFSRRRGYTFMHKHETQDEVYIFLKGSGVMQINDEQIEVSAGDMIKIPPEGKRALSASDTEDIVGICVGGIPTTEFPRKENSRAVFDDGIPLFDELPLWYEGNKKVKMINEKMKKREGNK